MSTLENAFNTSSIQAIRGLISNPIDYPEELPFAAILGEAPSKGARSPKLWNMAFKAFGLSSQMLPMDVSRHQLPNLLAALAENPNFVGGAIAVPHKIAVAQWLGEALTPEARAIGAVNCLYRNEAGQLIGTNTDGEAARLSIVETMGAIEGKTLLVLGTGGAGKAVAAYLSRAVTVGGAIWIAYYRHALDPVQQAALGVRRILAWDEILAVLPQIDVLINCTTVGSTKTPDDSPLSAEELALLKADTLVYDIIYDPRPTRLINLARERGLQVLDGLGMNLEQAVIAFRYALKYLLPAIDMELIRKAMSSA